jgi:CBS domain-containing protein
MARTVREIMNRELVATRAGERPSRIRETILALGITSMPVLDDEGRPLGVVSLRDLFVSDEAKNPVSTPALAVSAEATIEDGARRLAETEYHHLVVVDADGRAVGMVSSVDFMRALLGMPARHPPSFPHYDAKHGVAWTDDTELASDRLGVAPAGPGIFVLVHGGSGISERPVWAEQCDNVRARLDEILRAPAEAARISGGADRRQLRFRATAVQGMDQRTELIRRLHATL